MTQAGGALRKTPLNDVHRRMGARMVDFEGWEMPVQYSGVLEEHRTVRQGVGVFDVSHMGEIEVIGAGALGLVNWVTTNDASKLSIGQAQYSALLYPHGGFVDDILVHKVAEEHYFLCVNAGNQEKDYEHIAARRSGTCATQNVGERYAQIAVQGPRAVETLRKITAVGIERIGYYHFVDGVMAGVEARVARTGYTGEDGFEIYVAPGHAVGLWDEILSAGAEFGIKPCGLGARNTLRLEAGMALYGHEIHASTTAWEAGLGWIVKLEKGDFVGREALSRQKSWGVARKLMGFEMTGRGIGRDGYEVFVDGAAAGWVTSGGPSPTLNKNIGMCYLPGALAQVGRTIHIMVRGVAVPAVTVPVPFYKRAK
jgi:aminomethyltransferase